MKTVISLIFDDGTAGLTATSATVNAVDVLSSFAEVGSGEYSVTYATAADDTEWPWRGLHVELELMGVGGETLDLSAHVVAGSTLTEESAARGFSSEFLIDGMHGVCMADVDWDGDVDFLVVQRGNVNWLFLNDGDGHFSESAAELGVAGAVPDDSFACVFGDADGDGDLDLFVSLYSSSPNQLYMWDGTTYTEEAGSRGLAGSSTTLSGTWLDVDSDGDLDIVVVMADGNLLYLNDGAGMFDTSAGRGIAAGGHQAVAFDVDRDGDLDILLGNQLLLNNGFGVFQDQASSFGFEGGGHYYILGDVTGDGWPDVYGSRSGARDLLFVASSGLFDEVSSIRGLASATGVSHGAVMWDVDHDGDMDMLVGVEGGQDMGWVNAGGGWFTNTTIPLGVADMGFAWAMAAGDVDGDGDLDAVVSRSRLLYVNHAARSGIANWIKVRVLTAAGAQSAFGSTVHVMCTGSSSVGAWQSTRVLDGGSGFYSQSAYDAHFGLPDPDAVYNVSVAWVGGAISNWTTRSALGGIVPASLSDDRRLLVVRPAPVSLSVSVPPWDYASLGREPIAGETATVTITTTPPARLLFVSSASVNGQDVSESFNEVGAGVYTVSHSTQVDDTLWPSRGLGVELVLQDTGGLTHAVTTRLVAGSSLVEAASTAGLSALASPTTRGICAGDVDGDGDVDVAVAGYGASTLLFLNDGTGIFTEAAQAKGVSGDPSDSSHSCAFGDADGDGDLDLFLTVLASPNELYVWNGVDFTEEGSIRGIDGTEYSNGLVWFDADADGALDVFVCNDGSSNSLFMNGGEGVFTHAAVARGVAGGASASIQAAAADVDADGDVDVVVLNTDSADQLYINRGTGFFVDEIGSRGFTAGSASLGVSAGDINGDGWVDLFVSRWGQPDLLFVNDGGGVFSDAHEFGTAAQSRDIALVDLELDGNLDVFVVTVGGADMLWRNTGSFGPTLHDEAEAFGISNSAGDAFSAAPFDADGDGDIDVLVSGSARLYMNTNARSGLANWLKVRPLTAAGAQSAFGTTVRTACVMGPERGWLGVRTLDGGSGYYSQSGYDAHFGLPDPNGVYNVSVAWVGGEISNWTTHRRLGGVVPSSLPDEQRLFVVRPAPVSLSVSVPPWDYASLGREPITGETATLTITTTPAARLLFVSSASVNGQDVSASFVEVGGGAYTLSYTTATEDTQWPWRGLDVQFALKDTGGLLHAASFRLVAGSSFSEAAAERGLALLGLGGLCMADMDADGDVDMYLIRSNSPNQLFVNTGGSFTEAADAFGVAGDPMHLSSGCSWCDVDGNGFLDLLVTAAAWSVPEQHMLLFMQGPDGFVEDAEGRGVAKSGDSWAPVWLDANSDGAMDLIVPDDERAIFFYVNNGTGYFAPPVHLGGTGGNLAVAADVDGDGDVDFVASTVHRTTGAMVYSNVDMGTWSANPIGSGGAGKVYCWGIAVGDADGDGWLDVYLSTASIADTRSVDFLFVNNGDGTFTERTTARGMGGINRQSYGVAMFDAEHDGDEDIVVAVNEASSLLWQNSGDSFIDAAAGFGVSGWAGGSIALGDLDGDGDMDIVHPGSGQMLLSHAARPGLANWLKVRPLTAGGVQSAFGAMVRLFGDGGWTGLRVVDGGSGRYSQNAYDAHFGVPDPDGEYAISVIFPGGATHDMTTDPALVSIVPSAMPPEDRTIVVWDRPYITNYIASPSTGLLRVNATISITITAGRLRTDLLPGPDCCWVNGVQVRHTLVNSGDGIYNLGYILREGDTEWGAGALSVVAPLMDPRYNLSAVTIASIVSSSPAGDPVPPVLHIECGPTPVSPLEFQPLCLSCPSESGCTFRYAITVNGVQASPTKVLPSNMTSATTAELLLGPFAHNDAVELLLTVEDAAVNSAPPTTLAWHVDLKSPVTTLLTTPPRISPRSDATFTLGCTEDVCLYDYALDGGAWTSVGGNDTTDQGEVPQLDTLLTAAPPRLSNTSSGTFVFSVNATTPELMVNASLVVSVEPGGTMWDLPLHGNTTEALILRDLSDGVHVVTAVAESPALRDTSPLTYAFRVDTTPPSAVLLVAPEDGDSEEHVTLVVGCSELDCTYKWRSDAALGDAPWQESVHGVLGIQGVQGGVTHAVQVRAVDATGNVGSIVSMEWTPALCADVDLPTLVLSSDPSVGEGTLFVSWEAATPWPQFEYAVDDGEWTPTNRQYLTLDSLQRGQYHSIRVRAAVNSACNAAIASTRPAPSTLTWWEEPPAPPTVNITTAPSASTPDVFAVLHLAASRHLSWLSYRLDGAARWTPCSSVLRLGPLQPGPHVVEVRAENAAGTAGPASRYTWTIVSEAWSSVVLSGLPDGDHELTVRATDAGGSVEVAPKPFKWRVDTVPPETVVNRTSRRYSTERMVQLDVGCSGEVDPCWYCWTSASVEEGCSGNSTLRLLGPSDGDHALSLYAVDSAGLQDDTPALVLWTVDATPPNTMLGDAHGVLLPAPPSVSVADWLLAAHTLTLNLSATEAVTGFHLTAASQSWSAVGPLVTLVDLVEAPVTITVGAEDLAGNVDPSPAVVRVLVDVTPPVSRLTAPPSTNSSVLHVDVSAVDRLGASGVASVAVSAVSRVGRTAASVSGPSGTAVLSNLTTGVYNVSVSSVDAAGNTEVGGPWLIVEVDLDPPEARFTTVPPAVVNSSAVVAMGASDEAGAVYGRAVAWTNLSTNSSTNWTDWTAWNTSTGEVTLVVMPDGHYTLHLRAVDDAGNVQPPPYAGANVSVDTTPPVLRWTSTPDNPTREATVTGCFVAEDLTPVTFTARLAGFATHMSAGGCFNATVPADGLATVSVSSQDAAGNNGAPLTASWLLDRVPPTTVVLANFSSSDCVEVDGVVVCPSAAAARIAVTCSDGAPAVEVAPCFPQHVVHTVSVATDNECVATQRRLQGSGAFLDTPTPDSFSLAPSALDGYYRATLRSVDAAGNVEAGNVTMEWHVDTAPPSAAPTLDQTPEKAVSVRSALFLLRLEGDASPGQTTFWYKLDGGPKTRVPELPVPNTAAVQLTVPSAGSPDLGDGQHVLEVWARDQAGNDGPSAVYDWFVTAKAPDLVIIRGPAPVSGDDAPLFLFRAVWGPSSARNGSEPAAAVEVSLGSGFTVVCEDTATSSGTCSWNASLSASGTGTYTLTARASFANAVGDPQAYSWTYHLCSGDEYAEVGANTAITCLPCPPGANCEGGLTQRHELVAQPGFWAPAGTTGLRFYECPIPDACLAGGISATANGSILIASVCEEGYTGTLCAVCADGYFEQFGLCVSCGTQSGIAWLIMFVVLLVVIGVAVLFFKYRELMPIDQLKVTLSMVQIIASANTAYAIPWPPLFADFLNTMRVFLIEAVSLTRANCAQPMTFYGSLVVTLVAFKVVLLVVVLGPVAVHKCKQRRHTMPPALSAGAQGTGARRSSLVQSMISAVHAAQAIDWAKIFKITFLFLFVAYPGVSLKIMTIFKCVEVEGQHWLVADMRLKCYEGDWYGYALYAFVMGCLYTGGLPLAISVILWRNRRKLVDAGVVAKWGFLYQTYGVHAYLWEVVELLRKLWLSALVVLMAEGSPLQVTVAVLISGWAHVMHALYKPWRGVGDGGNLVYALQHGSLLVTFFVFLMGLLFKVDGVSQDSTTYTLLAWLMLLACVAFLVAACIVLMIAGRAQLRALRRKTVVVGRSQSRRTTVEKITSWGGAAPDSNARSASTPHTVRAAPQRGMSWVGNPLQRKHGKTPNVREAQTSQ